MKALYTFLAAMLLLLTSAQTRPGSLRGTVTDARSGDSIPYAEIVIHTAGGEIVAKGISAANGTYHINPVKPGTYSLTCSFIGYAKVSVKGVVIISNAPSNYDFNLQQQSEELMEVMLLYEAPLIEKTKSSKLTTSEDIMNMAVRDISSVSAQSTGVTMESEPEIRGSRAEGTVYFVDGVKVRVDADAPQAATVHTKLLGAGLPDQYGDHPSSLSDFQIFNVHEDFSQPAPAPPSQKPAEANARVLTAAELHDFSKWELWKDISGNDFSKWSRHWQVKPQERFSVQLTYSGGTPAVNVRAMLKQDGRVLWQSRTDNTGKAELWLHPYGSDDRDPEPTLWVEYDGQEHELKNPKLFSAGINELRLNSACEAPQHIDIAFMVDATGSMGDEIRYLQKELEDIINAVKFRLANSEVRLGTVFYRDHHDDYLTRTQPLTTEIEQVIHFIAEQKAAGGGDYPEAVTEALEVSINNLQWNEQAAARLLFLILDAPPHHTPEDLHRIKQLMAAAAAKGIRIIPVTASGIDKSTEYLMRSAALLTNGTYVFLTDDSGVGNPHLKPTTDSYEVELLNDLLQRLIYQYTYLPGCREDIPVFVNDSSLHSSEDYTIVKKAQNFEWQYFPNPTRSVLHVETSGPVAELFVTDLNGKIILRHQCTGKQEQLDLSPFPVGTYFLRFMNGQNWSQGKILKI